MENIHYTYGLDGIDAIASSILSHLNTKIVLFNGDMGAGKTTLIKALLKALNSEDIATSPTFSIVNEYEIPNDKIYHFDFYRIEDIEEVYNFGIEDYFASNHWLFIEWSERIADLIPEDICIIDIKMIDFETRSLNLYIKNTKLTQIKTQKQKA